MEKFSLDVETIYAQDAGTQVWVVMIVVSLCDTINELVMMETAFILLMSWWWWNYTPYSGKHLQPRWQPAQGSACWMDRHRRGCRWIKRVQASLPPMLSVILRLNNMYYLINFFIWCTLEWGSAAVSIHKDWSRPISERMDQYREVWWRQLPC